MWHSCLNGEIQDAALETMLRCLGQSCNLTKIKYISKRVLKDKESTARTALELTVKRVPAPVRPVGVRQVEPTGSERLQSTSVGIAMCSRTLLSSYNLGLFLSPGVKPSVSSTLSTNSYIPQGSDLWPSGLGTSSTSISSLDRNAFALWFLIGWLFSLSLSLFFLT